MEERRAVGGGETFCISLVDRGFKLTDDVALQHSRSRRTFQEEQARILAATNSTIAVECNAAVFESTLTPAGSTCASLCSHLANVVASTVGNSSDQSSFVHDTEEKRWLHDRTKEEHRKHLGFHRRTFRHRSPGHDLWTGLQPPRLLFPCPCARYRFRQRCERAFDVQVDHSERQRWQTTKLSTLTFPQILWN